MSRPSKISRLPRPLRDELNRRLDRHIPAHSLLHWLNSLPEVQTVLTDYFHSDPITEQNLSNWRHSGFLEWQTRQEFLHQVQNLSADAAEIEADAASMAEHATRLLSIHFALTLSQSLQASPSSTPAPPTPTLTHPHPPHEPPAPYQPYSACQPYPPYSPPPPPHEPTQSSVPSPQHSLPLPVSSPFPTRSLRPLCELARALSSIRRADLAAAKFKSSRSSDEALIQERAKALFIGAQIAAIRARNPLFSEIPAPPTNEESGAAGPAAPPLPENLTTSPVPPPAANQPKSSYLKPFTPAPAPEVPSPSNSLSPSGPSGPFSPPSPPDINVPNH